MTIDYKIFTLELKSPFTISKGTFTERKSLILQLRHEENVGLGEATEISYYDVSLPHFCNIIEDNKSSLNEIPLNNPFDYHQEVKHVIGDHPFLLNAFDCAAHDLYSRSKGQTLQASLSINADKKLPKTSFTIGLGTKTEMAKKMLMKPWPIYKIKLGSNLRLDHIAYLRSRTNSVFRVDANGAWTADETVRYSQEIKSLGVQFVEQPVARENDYVLERIFDDCSLPLIADESCQVPGDVERCKGRFHGINIKLMKCGGITPALDMIRMARELDMKIMIGCMTESSIGISAAAQLIPLVDYVDLDGSMLIKNDIAKGVCFVQGMVQYPDALGTGSELIMDL